MPLIPLDLPAGVFRNGTDLQSQGRWRDANLVRWTEGTIRPFRGWRTRSDTAADAKIRGMIAWPDNVGDRHIVGGTYNKLYTWNSAGTRVDITPAGFSAGREDAAAFTGYGGNFYGSYAYGVARPDTARILPATTWSMSNWGQNLIACSQDDGKVYEWNPTVGGAAAVLTNAPTGNKAIIVTEERFLMCLGAGGDPRKVQWSDRENNNLWAPAATNEAGDLQLNTSGIIMSGLNVRGQTLILTSTDAHAANYIGPAYVYGIERVGTSCGLVAPNAAAVVDVGAFWMGTHSFFGYSGGAAQEIKCDVADYIFSDINRAQISKTFAVANSTYGEIFWFYPSSGSTENDRYVVYNYVEGTWYTGDLARTSGVDHGAFPLPIWADADDKKIYEHEVGFDYGSLTPFAETGPIIIGTGEAVASVTQMLPDERTQGDVTATFKTRFYSNGTERSYGPFSMSNPVSMRFTGRQIRMRISGARLADWRVGINRIDVVQGGKR